MTVLHLWLPRMSLHHKGAIFMTLLRLGLLKMILDQQEQIFMRSLTVTSRVSRSLIDNQFETLVIPI